jgi:hypothetical protein
VVRPQFNPKTNRLLVSKQGRSMTRTGIRDIVHNCCEKLRIKTFKGDIPFPHTLRHTLATLNIEPFGKSLSPRMMQQRLIHMDLETLERNYVHNNPLAEMKEYKRLLEKDTVGTALKKVSKEDLFEMLDSLPMAKSSSIFDIKKAYDNECKRLASQPDVANNDIKTVTEKEALNLLSGFAIEYRSLRKWGLEHNECRIINREATKSYLYNKQTIESLRKNYIDKRDAFRKFNGGRSVFYDRLKRCRKIYIGQRCLVFKDDLIDFLVANVKAIPVKCGERTYKPTFLSPVNAA